MMINKTKVRPAQTCERVITTAEGDIICPCPSTNNRSAAVMKKKRQLLVK